MKYLSIFLLVALISSTGCKDYLDIRSDKSLTVPATVEDFQSLLEYDWLCKYSPAGMVVGADNYYMKFDTWQSLDYYISRNSYIWAKDVYEGQAGERLDWGYLYHAIYICNVVLEGLEKVEQTSQNLQSYHFAKGMALFYRAFSFFGLSQVYAKPYIDRTASSDLGIPIRLNPDLDAPVNRASVKATYLQIISDLEKALPLLPDAVAVSYLNHPSKPSAYALLARVYLSMGKYQKAGRYADSSLQLYNRLLDYNDIDPAERFPFPIENPEVMLQCNINTSIPLLWTYSMDDKIIDSVLYRSYDRNDLRKTLFYNLTNDGTPYYYGSYAGSPFLFNGFATDEMLLIRAECEVRDGNVVAAINDLNTLLKMRWKTGTFVPYTENAVDNPLELILRERRKELVFRGLRWTDLRRLNQEKQFARTLTRNLNGETYTLPPGDPRYTYPIPNDEVKVHDLPQNNR